MECPNCHAENKDDSKFCSHCAAPLNVEETLPASLMKTLAIPLPVISKDALISGKYKVLEEIGRGGMGIVYKVEDIRLQRTVALKFLPPHLADSVELKESFLIEARAAAALSHPNICVIHEVGEDQDRSFIAMEYVDGETLRDKIKKGPLPAEETLAIASQVAAGLGEAHHKGIVHRDIKSANIMVYREGPGQGHGLRPGQAAGRIVADEEPDDTGNGGLHVPGAGTGRGGGRPDRHLVPRGHPL